MIRQLFNVENVCRKYSKNSGKMANLLFKIFIEILVD